MTRQPVEIDAIDWKRVFPWLRLFRVFRTAIDLRMLLLGCVALAALAAGDVLFFSLPFAPGASDPTSFSGWDQATRAPNMVRDTIVVDPLEHVRPIRSSVALIYRPLLSVANPVRTILRAEATWSRKAFAWTRLLWALCVWAVVAGAMTRIAAVEQARDLKVSLVGAIRFSLGNFLSYFTAVLLPVVAVLFFWFLCMIGGWTGQVPYIGPPLLGAFWGLELIFGVVMALVLIGAAAGWPLMYATISTEASDGFDGFSRAYSYVFSRPWHYLWFGIVATAYGVIVVAFVSFVASLVAYLSAAATASALGTASMQPLLLGAADSLGGPSLLTGSFEGHVGIGTTLVGAWLQVLALIVAGFATSYFWTSATAIYLLLRHVDDATDLHEVYLPEDKEVDDLLPLVGTAASDQPVIERPPQGDFAGGANVPPEVHAPGLRAAHEPLVEPTDVTVPTPPPLL